MKRKIFSIVTIILIVLSSIIIPKIYADTSVAVSIPQTTLKPGEQIKFNINIENINTYTLAQVVLKTDIYIEPEFDAASTGLTAADAIFNYSNTTFTISNIDKLTGIKTLCVKYTIPNYIANGTIINVAYTLNDINNQQQETNIIKVTVTSDNKTTQNRWY